MSFAIFIVAFAGVFVVISIVGVAIWAPARQADRRAEAQLWPTTEATVQGSEMRMVSRYESLPSFIFSYPVGEEYYSGWFTLSAEGERADALLKELDNKKFAIRYDPKDPSKFCISDEVIEGCTVQDQGKV